MIKVLKEWNNLSVLEVLTKSLLISKNKAKSLLDNKRVFVNQKRIWIAKYPVKTSDIIQVVEWQSSLDTKTPTIDILFEDDHFLVVNKPYGLSTNEKNSVQTKLQKTYNKKFLRAVHRLDKDTSGALIIAKDDKTFDKFKIIFSKLEIEKIYTCVVASSKQIPKNFTVDQSLDNKTAISKFELIKNCKNLAHLRVKILTGRKHQIRRHLQVLNLAILGDKEYSNKVSNSLSFRNIERQMLHAKEISFVHPYTNRLMTFSAPYFDDYKQVLKRFSL